MLKSSICAYCGCGCRLRFAVKGKRIEKVLPDRTDEISEGKPCIKGLTLHEVYDKGRIVQPMIRKRGNLKKVTWSEALRYVKEKTWDLAPSEVFFAPSGKTTNEDCYVMQKFARIVFNTNNVDGCCSRLCHAATLVATSEAYGIHAMPYTLNDIKNTDCLLIIGSNPASNYPVLFNRILEAKRRGCRIISVQSIFNEITQFADIQLVIQPGTYIALLNGIANHLIKTGKYDRNAEHCEGFDKLVETVKPYTGRKVCDICGISHRDFLSAADAISDSENFGALHGMGMTQHIKAVENVQSLLNLLILKNGKILSCRGEINVQGCGDMGCVPNIDTDLFERAWSVKLTRKLGITMINALSLSPVKACFISGFNPAQSMPDLNRVHRNLEEMFIVQMDSYLNLTSGFADVILPTPTLLERTGTITNGERRVRLVSGVIEPLGKSEQEWVVFRKLARMLGYGKHFPYRNARDVLHEITNVIPSYSGIDADSVYMGYDQFADKTIKFRKFIPAIFTGVDDVRSRRYPFLLTTFRSKYQFLTGEMTSKSETLQRVSKDGAYCYISRPDAERLKLRDGDNVTVESTAGSVVAKVKIDTRMQQGVVAMHFHFERLLVNKLFPSQFDTRSLTPNYKLVAVSIGKIDKPQKQEGR
ncbi:MAG TPA: hypothetical protein ENG00_01385 [Candidatus Aenigmarchaeota archaeon]|nr:hypothetical protein [Candidatus Aenigmarchaeota archaeon]